MNKNNEMLEMFKEVNTVNNIEGNLEIIFAWEKSIRENGVAGCIMVSDFDEIILVGVTDDNPYENDLRGRAARIDEKGNVVSIPRSTYNALFSSDEALKNAAYYILYHEIGHILSGDVDEDEDMIESLDWEREELCLLGKVLYREFSADAFAASIIGFDNVINAINLIQSNYFAKLKSFKLEHDESLSRGIKEYLARIELIKKLQRGEKIKEVCTEYGIIAE